MSHVDEGTLHAYLDGELPPAEVQGVAAHVVQCSACRIRLDEERALIARADELLGSAAPPDRAIPPFHAGDREPPVRLWWRVRFPLAWAATVVLALGIGVYVGSRPGARRTAEGSSDVATNAAPKSLAASESAAAKRTEPRRSRRAAPTQAQPATGALAQQNQAEERVTRQQETPQETASALRLRGEAAGGAIEQDRVAAPPPAPAAAGPVSRGLYVLTGSPITSDSARAVLGTDPFVVPGLPIRTFHQARLIGYSILVVVDQALDSSTTIQVINGRQTPGALERVVVTGNARPDTATLSQRALLGRAAPPADSVAPVARKGAAPPTRAPSAAGDRASTGLFLEVRGPLSADSLAALQRRLQPLRP